MPPKPVSKTKAKSKVKKMLRKAENAVMIEKMNTLRRALFDDAGVERWVVPLCDTPGIVICAPKKMNGRGRDVHRHCHCPVCA